MRNQRKAATITAAVLAVVAFCSVTAPSSASARMTAAPCKPAWQLVPLPQADLSNVAYPEFLGSEPSVVSSDDVWDNASFDVPFHSWLLNWNGSSVTQPPQVPVIPGTELGQYTEHTSFDSASDGWAAGQYITLDGLGLDWGARWHGGRWTLTPFAVQPNAGSTGTQVHGLAALAPDNAWAVGAVYQGGPGVIMGTDPIGTLIEHWDGTQWKIVPNPAGSQAGAALVGMQARSAADIWAVGYQTDKAGHILPLIEQWNGTKWSVIPAPPGNEPAALYAVSADSATDAWATGVQTQPGTANIAISLAEHWNGTSWSMVKLPASLGNTYLGSVYAATPTKVWATTYQAGAGASEFVHWDGKAWTATPVPGPKASGFGYFYGGYGEGGGVSGSGPDNIWAAGSMYNFGALSAAPQLAHLTCATSRS